MTTTELKPNFCPKCFAFVDDATGVRTEDRPGPGSYCICLFCGEMLKFEQDMSLSILTYPEREVLAIEAPAFFRFMCDLSDYTRELKVKDPAQKTSVKQ